MKRLLLLLTALSLLPATAFCESASRISDATQACLSCHESVHPGIVGDWKTSRHSVVTPAEGMSVKDASRMVSAREVPEDLKNVIVGCAECHTQNPDKHKDSFEHNGFTVHVVVSPEDCATCHQTERAQYAENVMAHAYGNLANNKLYGMLVKSVNGTLTYAKGALTQAAPDAAANADSCFYCHGTVVEAGPLETRDTVMGEMQFPKLTGWPNQGVGRINPDGSMGSCAPCHARHGFSIAVARKPYTCEECHNGPDVPAYKVYATSKHGNIFASESKDWNFKAVPWTIGKDFTTPTCAACHVSQLAAEDGTVVSERTHKMTDRLSWRIFGPVYAHPQPKLPNTDIIINKDGLQLPTTLDNQPASKFLIDAEEMKTRRETMQAACLACHATDWVSGYWMRLDNTVEQTNATVLAATDIMQEAWRKGLAVGPGKGNPFDEYIENVWTDAWLFSAHSVRYSSAMGGGGDYGAFADGRINLNKHVREMKDWLDLRLSKK